MPVSGRSRAVELEGEVAQVLRGGREGHVRGKGLGLGPEIAGGGVLGPLQSAALRLVEGERGGDQGAEGGDEEKGDDQAGPQPPEKARPAAPRRSHSGPNR